MQRTGIRISAKRAYIGVCLEMTDCRAAEWATVALDVRHFDRVLLTKVTDDGIQLQHRRRIVSRRDPQEEACGFRLSALRHRGRRGPICDRATAGGFAERRLSSG